MAVIQTSRTRPIPQKEAELLLRDVKARGFNTHPATTRLKMALEAARDGKVWLSDAQYITLNRLAR